MQVPHVRMVMHNRPHELATNRQIEFFITFPGEPEKKLPWVRGMSHKINMGSPQEMTLTMLATTEVQYGE